MNTNRCLSRLAVTALASVGVAAAFLPPAQAQPPAPTAGGHAPMRGMNMDPAQRAKMKAMYDKMMADLHLTPDQQTKLTKLRAETQKQGMTIYTDKTMSGDQKQAKLTSLRTDSVTKMNAILTPVQRTKMQVMQQQMMKQMMQQMRTQAPPPAAH